MERDGSADMIHNGSFLGKGPMSRSVSSTYGVDDFRHSVPFASTPSNLLDAFERCPTAHGEWLHPSDTAIEIEEHLLALTDTEGSKPAPTPLAPPRSLCRPYGTATAIGNSVFLIGGIEQPQFLTVWDLATRRHRDVPVTGDVPTDLSQHTAVTFADGSSPTGRREIYLVGHQAQRRQWLHVLDVDTLVVKRLEPRCPDPDPSMIPDTLYCHVSAAFMHPTRGRMILTFGGADGSRALSNLFAYWVEENLWERIIPKGRLKPHMRVYHAGCGARNRYLYVYGGSPDARNTRMNDVVFDDFWRFDLTSMEWERLKPRGMRQPCRRGSCSLLYHEPYLFLYGGYDGNRDFQDFYRYDIDRSWWIRLEHPDAEAEETDEPRADEPGSRPPPSPPPAESRTRGDHDGVLQLLRAGAPEVPELNGTPSVAAPTSGTLTVPNGRWGYAACVIQPNTLFYAGGFQHSDNPAVHPFSGMFVMPAQNMEVALFQPEEVSLKHVLARFIVDHDLFATQFSS